MVWTPPKVSADLQDHVELSRRNRDEEHQEEAEHALQARGETLRALPAGPDRLGRGLSSRRAAAVCRRPGPQPGRHGPAPSPAGRRRPGRHRPGRRPTGPGPRPRPSPPPSCARSSTPPACSCTRTWGGRRSPTTQAATYTNLELRPDHRRAGLPGRPTPPGCWPGPVGPRRPPVVNNGAAAVLLALAALARDRAVVVSRGELVEIGGGFRIPEILASPAPAWSRSAPPTGPGGPTTSGPSPPTTGLLLKVHQSNYRITGFTEAVDVDGPDRPGAGRGRGPGLRAPRRGLPLAGRRPAGLAAGRAGGPPDAGGRRRRS